MKLKMRKIGVLVLAFVCVGTAFSNEPDPDTILRNMELALFPEEYYSVMSMTTTIPGKRDRFMEIESYYKEDVGSFMEVLGPVRSKGIRFLQKDDSLWMFNPKSNSRRAVRLSAKDSFQGSVFSNNDISDPKYTDDYSTQIIREEVIEHPDGSGSVEVWVLEAVASHREAPYGKMQIWVAKNSNIPFRMDYYAKSGLLFKRMTFSNIQEIGGRRRPRLFRMDSFEQEGAHTVVTIEELEIRTDIPDSVFSERALTR